MGTGTTLRLWLDDTDIDTDNDDEIAELRQLLGEAGASEVGVPRFGEPAPGKRGPDESAVVADVVATLSPELGLVQRVVTALRNWLARRPRRTLKLTIGDAAIELSGYSTATEEQLVATFVAHVADQARPGG
jgi:hypothetical protein